ncbi:sex peptide receptor-like [Gigantopelta aegis]|uniref:sex peptide receptor-like n=1 Tax=Gigantopelta aegis TaxID=1735272 RepID=UPI001B88BA05|nr:sex peptide receptor-like [Gigantopelta aegis]
MADDYPRINETYHRCLSFVSSRYGVSDSDISALTSVQNMCSNLSKLAERSRQLQGVLDLEQTAPADLAKPLYGYAAPTVVFISLLLNTVLVRNLTSKRLRSPTNVILAAMAIVDTLTGLVMMPYFVYAYTLDGYKKYPSMVWCYVYQYGRLLIPTCLHTIALWLTVLLSWQRYVGVSSRSCLRCICQYKGISLAIAGVVLFSCVLHSFQLLMYLQPITVVGKELFDQKGVILVETCSQRLSDRISNDSFIYIYTWIRLTLAEIVPCVLLTCFNVLLVKVTYVSFSYRRRLVIGNKLVQSTELRLILRTSAMLLLIAFSTLLVELFVAVNLLIKFVQEYHKTLQLISQDVLSRCTVISNFIIIATFPLNFVFCVCLSSGFRERLWRCLKPSRRRKITPRQLDPGQPEPREPVQQISLISVLRYSRQST